MLPLCDRQYQCLRCRHRIPKKNLHLSRRDSFQPTNGSFHKHLFRVSRQEPALPGLHRPPTTEQRCAVSARAGTLLGRGPSSAAETSTDALPPALAFGRRPRESGCWPDGDSLSLTSTAFTVLRGSGETTSTEREGSGLNSDRRVLPDRFARVRPPGLPPTSRSRNVPKRQSSVGRWPPNRSPSKRAERKTAERGRARPSAAVEKRDLFPPGQDCHYQVEAREAGARTSAV